MGSRPPLPPKMKLSLIVMPIIIAALVIGGIFLGFYLTEVWGSPSPIIYPLLFSTLGFSLSLVLIYLIAKRAAR